MTKKAMKRRRKTMMKCARSGLWPNSRCFGELKLQLRASQTVIFMRMSTITAMKMKMTTMTRRRRQKEEEYCEEWMKKLQLA